MTGVVRRLGVVGIGVAPQGGVSLAPLLRREPRMEPNSARWLRAAGEPEH